MEPNNTNKSSPRKLSPASTPTTKSRPGTPSPPPVSENGVVQHKRLKSLQTELKKDSKNQLLAVPEPTSPPVPSGSAPNTTRHRRAHGETFCRVLRPPKLNIKLREQRDLIITNDDNEEDIEIEKLLIEFCNSCCKGEKETQKMINVSDLSLYLRGQIPPFMQQFGK